MKVFSINLFEWFCIEHHFLTGRTRILLSALFAQWIVLITTFFFAVGLIASLGKTVVQLKLMKFNEVMVASNAIE